MSINEDDWYYGENNQRWIPRGDIARYMQGDGFEEERDPYRSSDEFDVSLVGQTIRPCGCDVQKFSKAVDELLTALRDRPQMFPEHENQFDSFAQVGGYAGGPWHKFVDISGSRIETRDEHGFIKLGSNCGVAGHSCKIIRVAENEFIIEGLSENPEVTKADNFSTSIPRDVEYQYENHRIDEIDSHSFFEDEESEDEAQMYDERTFGDLDETPPRLDEDPLTMSPDMWRSSAFSDEKVLVYMAALLEPRDIAYISRFMPPDEISEWIAEFGENSLDALQMLNIALGGLHHVDPDNADRYDTAVTRLTGDIRAAVKKHYVKYKKEVAHLEQKRRSNRESFRSP